MSYHGKSLVSAIGRKYGVIWKKNNCAAGIVTTHRKLPSRCSLSTFNFPFLFRNLAIDICRSLMTSHICRAPQDYEDYLLPPTFPISLMIFYPMRAQGIKLGNWKETTEKALPHI